MVDVATNTKEFVFSAFLQLLKISMPVGCCAISQFRVDATIHGDWMFYPFTGFGFGLSDQYLQCYLSIYAQGVHLQHCG